MKRTMISLGSLVLSAGIAQADVTLEERISVEGAGIMRMANMSGTSKTTIAGDRSRTESDLQMQSRLVRMLARNAVGPSAEIVRLDQDKIYHLDLKKKEYTEQSFEQLRTQIETAQQQAGQAGQGAPPAPIDESKCEWSEPKADVRRTGESATIAGLSAERITIVASQSCRHRETGQVCDLALALDQWLAPQFPGGDDALKFQRAYAQKMGLGDTMQRDVGERAEAMFGRYEGVWKEIARKTGDVKGYPVKSSFAFALGGEQCQNNAQTQQQQSSGSDSATPGGIAGQIGGRLAGALFKRNKQESSQSGGAAQTSSVLPAGMLPMITISSELLSVSTSAAAPGSFDVPADFKKAAAP